MRLTDRWAQEKIGFVWKGTRQEFEENEKLTLEKRVGDTYYYTNEKGKEVVYNDKTKVYYF